MFALSSRHASLCLSTAMCCTQYSKLIFFARAAGVKREEEAVCECVLNLSAYLLSECSEGPD